jgi:hypothetical protein
VNVVGPNFVLDSFEQPIASVSGVATDSNRPLVATRVVSADDVGNEHTHFVHTSRRSVFPDTTKAPHKQGSKPVTPQLVHSAQGLIRNW